MPKTRFKRLEYLYLIALGCIALSIVVSQVLIQTSIDSQQDDGRVINIAGRQRMLSQKISKLALKIEQGRSGLSKDKAALDAALSLWKQSHEGLSKGDSSLGLPAKNSADITAKFESIEPHFQVIYSSATKLIQDTTQNDSLISNYVLSILANDEIFLAKMDKIVFQYDLEASTKVSQLRNTEYYLFMISLLIILGELIFVFRPLAKNIRESVLSLESSEKSSKKMAEELSKLYEELGKSYQDLEAVSATPESPSLYGTIAINGEFVYYSPKFLRLMEYEETKPPVTFQELLLAAGYKDSFVEGLMSLLGEKQNWTGEIKLVTEPGDFCWLETYLVPVSPTDQVKIIAKDVTEFKEAKIRSRELNRERIEKSVKEQSYRSSLILEGQEEERKRLSRELHDGVGQMMSAMNMLLQSITPSSKPMKMRLEDAKDLMKSIIREIRRVSFNLTPSSLDDFGLVAAVNKFCEEINGVTKTKVSFRNETRFINRLDSKVETNLYRIVQEAVNNALKYAKATSISVHFSHTINSLQVIIEDDGKGFDLEQIEKSGHFEKAGHGIFNMRERVSYIGGTIELNSQPDKGTRINITLSLDKND